jgi:hypothetical protein
MEIRRDIVQLFSDILQTIAKHIHRLVDEAAVHVPQVVDRVLTHYRSEKVLGLMDVYCNCIAWFSRLRILTRDVNAWWKHVSGNSEISAVLLPDEDAPLRHSPLGKRSAAGAPDQDAPLGDSGLARKYTEVDQSVQLLLGTMDQQISSISQDIKRIPPPGNEGHSYYVPPV